MALRTEQKMEFKHYSIRETYRRNMLSEVLFVYESSDEGPRDLRDLRKRKIR